MCVYVVDKDKLGVHVVLNEFECIIAFLNVIYGIIDY